MATYDLLDSTTLTSSASSVTFSSISQGYRDLVLVATGTTSTATYRAVQLNGDTGSNYSYVNAAGDGSATNSYAGTTTRVFWDFYQASSTSVIAQAQIQILDYSATDKHKPILVRNGGADESVEMRAVRWANTSAVTSLSFLASGNYNAGSTFYLYGIAS